MKKNLKNFNFTPELVNPIKLEETFLSLKFVCHKLYGSWFPIAKNEKKTFMLLTDLDAVKNFKLLTCRFLKIFSKISLISDQFEIKKNF